MDKEKLLKDMAETRNAYARKCSTNIEREYGKIEGADFMLQNIIASINAEEEQE